MKKSVNTVMGLFEWVLLILLAAIWGGSFFFGKIAVSELPPFTIVLGRVGMAALVLNAIVAATGRRMPRSLRTWGLFMVMGVLNNIIPFSLIFWGEIRIASGLASILNATTPLWTVLLAHFLTQDEKLNIGRLSGVLLGIIGGAIIIGPDALKAFGSDVLAQMAVVGAAFSYAFAGIFGKRFKNLSPYITATGQLTCSALIMLPVTVLVDKPWMMHMPGPRIWCSVIALALVCTALAYVIYFRILATAGATNIVLVTFLIPVSALFLGMILLGERLELRHFAGMAFIGCGLAAIDGRIKNFIGTRRLTGAGNTTEEIKIFSGGADDYSI
jgi:drug/metabolite transporter (DMT)-like permease